MPAGSCDSSSVRAPSNQLKQNRLEQPDAAAAVNKLPARGARVHPGLPQGGTRSWPSTSTRTVPVHRSRVRRHAHAHTVASGVDPGVVRVPPDFPAAFAAAGSSDLFYWSLADFDSSRRPVEPPFVYSTGEPPALRYAVAVKQLYPVTTSTRALEIRAVIDDAPARARQARRCAQHGEVDGLTGSVGGVVKSKVRGRSRESLEKALAAIKRWPRRHRDRSAGGRTDRIDYLSSGYRICRLRRRGMTHRRIGGSSCSSPESRRRFDGGTDARCPQQRGRRCRYQLGMASTPREFSLDQSWR